MVGYIFGGNTGITPEELAQRRQMARAMVRSGTEETPRTIGQGIAAIARALSGNYADFKTGQEQEKQQGAATDRFNALFQPKDAAVTPVAYSPNEQTGAPGYRGIAKVMPKNDTGSWLNDQLRNDPDLKLTPAAAAGITGNLDLETGGFKHMQEIKPMVPGSRGGYGMAQWTGPRRVQFENWAKANNLDPASKEANFGFLKHELMNTPEGKVLASLQGVDDAGQAATIFSDQYLRPGIPHMDRRVAAAQGYAGGSAPSVQPAGGAQPVRLAQTGGPSLNDLLRAAADPWTSDSQRDVLKVYIDQALKSADPLHQLQLEEGRLKIDALKNPKAEYGFTTLPDGTVLRTDKGKGTAEPIMKGNQKPTDDEQELASINAQRKAAGLPEMRLDEWLLSKGKAGATSIDMGTEGPPDTKLRTKLQEKEADTWSNYQAAAVQSAGLTQQLDVMDELLKMAPQGPLQGRLAQMFPGFSTAGDAITSMANRIAPSFRIPGSGAQSDKELDGFLSSLPRLQTSPGGNQIISATLRAKAAIDMERGQIVDAYADGTISAPDARKRMNELNKRSIMTPELQAVINATTEQPETGTPDADGWTTLPNGVKIREKK